MMPSWENEIANETFVSIDDEVAAKLLWFFFAFDQLCGGKIAKVASNGLGFTLRGEAREAATKTHPNHDWYQTAIFVFRVLLFSVNFPG